MGDNSQTTTTGLNSSSLGQAVNTIGTQLNTQLGQGLNPYPLSSHVGQSNQTVSGINNLWGASQNAGGLTAANNWNTGVIGSGGYNSALTAAQGGIQSFLDENNADAPGFSALRQKLSNDVISGTNAAFNANGRFGGGSNVQDVSQGLAGSLGALDYQQYNDRLSRKLAGNQALAGVGQTAMGNAAGAASAAPGFYQAGLMPSLAQIQAGGLIDQNAQAQRLGEIDLWNRTKNNGWNTLAQATQILAGTAPSAGQTTTQTQQVPWWQTAAQIGGTVLGKVF